MSFMEEGVWHKAPEINEVVEVGSRRLRIILNEMISDGMIEDDGQTKGKRYRIKEREKCMKREKNTYEKIYDVVRQIPKGTVATYGQVAALAGNRRWARVVGYALHVNPDPDSIPCHRVVTKDGRVSPAFAFGGENRQVELLQAEGVRFRDGCVVMEKYRWEV